MSIWGIVGDVATFEFIESMPPFLPVWEHALGEEWWPKNFGTYQVLLGED